MNKILSYFFICSRTIVKEAYKKAELDETKYATHTLRHTCATLLYRNGTDIKTIKEVLGHVQIDTTEIYTHLYNKQVMDVDLILRSLELYSYNLEFMLNAEESDEEKKREKLAQLKYTYEQVLSSLAEQVNGKAEEYENRRTTGRNMLGDNIIDIIPANKEKFQVG